MEQLYRHLGFSRQALHQKQRRSVSQKLVEEGLIEAVRVERATHPTMGSRSLYYKLGVKELGVTKFEQLLSKYDLTIQTKRKRIKTTDSKGSKRYPNLINGLKINGPNQLIVADITYYNIENQWYYIFTLKDVYHQCILSLRGYDNMRAVNAMKMLEDYQAIRGVGPFENLIFHSDNGSQFDAIGFVKELNGMKMRISRAQNSLENGSSENLNSVVKNHYLDELDIRSLKELQKELNELKDKLNFEKPIKELRYKTSAEFEKWVLKLKEVERPVKKLYNFESKEKGFKLRWVF